MGQLRTQRGARARMSLCGAVVVLLLLPGTAGADLKIFSQMPVLGGGQLGVAETKGTVPLDPGCQAGIYSEFLTLLNNTKLLSGQLLDPNGQPYSNSNPLCGPNSTFTNFSVTDNANPGIPPSDGPDNHWAVMQFTIGGTVNPGATPLIQPQMTFNAPFCQAQTPSGIPSARSQGITELLNDVTLNCTGGQPVLSSEQVPATNIKLTLNTNVTSRLFQPPFGESLALVADPASADQRPCLPSTVGGRCTFTGSDTSPPNIFQGTVSGNQVTFFAVPVDPLSPNDSGRVVRLTNIRANAAILGNVKDIQGTVSFFHFPFGATQGPIDLAQLGSGPFVSLVNPSGGTVIPSILPQCQTGKQTVTVGGVEIHGDFGTAFQTRLISTTPSNAGGAPASQDTPGQIDHSETGFFNNGFPTISGQGDLGQAGLANFGDRIFLDVNHAPGGLQLLVPQQLNGTNGGEAIRVQDPIGPFAPFTPASGLPSGLGQIPLSGGSGIVAFEVVAGNTGSPTAFKIPISVRAIGAPGTGTIDISGGLGPLSTVNGASATAPIPRFHAFPLNNAPLFSVNACPQSFLQIPIQNDTIKYTPGSGRLPVPLRDTGSFSIDGTAKFLLHAFFLSPDTAAAARATTIATGSFSLSKHAQTTADLTLTRAGKLLLKHHHSLKALLELNITGNRLSALIKRTVKLAPG